MRCESAVRNSFLSLRIGKWAEVPLSIGSVDVSSTGLMCGEIAARSSSLSLRIGKWVADPLSIRSVDVSSTEPM